MAARYGSRGGQLCWSYATRRYPLSHYAGHGVQIAGENYLIPVEFAAADEAMSSTLPTPGRGFRNAWKRRVHEILALTHVGDHRLHY